MDKSAVCAALGIFTYLPDSHVLAALVQMKEANKALEAKLATHVPTAKSFASENAMDATGPSAEHQRAIAFVESAIRDGKPIGSVRSQFIVQHVADPDQTEAVVNALPSFTSAIAKH